jgi:hypothetical protein
MILAIGITVFAVAASVVPTTADLATAALGPGGILAIAGNGGLTVGVDRDGRIGLCRWPSPGYYNQVRYRTRNDHSAPPGEGLMWGLRIHDRAFWLCGEPWDTTVRYARGDGSGIEISSALPESRVSVSEHVYVHPSQDLLLLRLTVHGCRSTPTIYWYANFSPCTRLIPELPVADWALDAWNDFAVFTVDGGTTLHHFRPRQPGADTWKKAEGLVASGAGLDAWRSFEDGVWIAYTSPNSVMGFQCAVDGSETSALAQAEKGALGNQPGAAGQCHAAVALAPIADGADYVATVVVAFGKNSNEATAALAYASERGYDALVDETTRYWTQWVSAATMPQTDNAALIAACKRDLVTLALCTDRETAAVVRSPVAQPPYAMDGAEHGAWVTLAYDLAGYHEAARRHSLFYCKAPRFASGGLLCEPRRGRSASRDAAGGRGLDAGGVLEYGVLYG